MEISEITKRMNEFVSLKGWYGKESARPQTKRNLAISLSLEANEVLEHFQWQEEPRDKEMFAGELADVALYLFQLASISGIDIEHAILDKLEVNSEREWD